MDFVGAIKSHPWISGAVAAIALLYILYTSGSSAQPVAGASADPYSDQLATAQLAAQTQTGMATIAANAQAAHDAASVEIGKRGYDSADFQNSLAAEVALSQIMSAADVTKTTNTLAAGVANNAQNQQTARDQIASNTTIQTTAALTKALTDQAKISAGTAQASIAAQQAIATQSWWDKLF